MVDLIEENTVRNSARPGAKVFLTPELNMSDPKLSERAWALAQEIDAELPEWGRTCWRWRLMYIRAFLDLHRYRNEKLHEVPEAVELMKEAADIYFCIPNYKIKDDPFHLKLRPPFPVYDDDFDPADYPTIGSIQNAASIGLIVSKKIKKVGGTEAGNQA